jgi:uridine kinase
MNSPFATRYKITEMQTTRDIETVRGAILSTPIREGRKARLIAISGIDSSGKGYVASKVAQALEVHGGRVALIGIDGWLNLPQVRFDKLSRHFYQNAIRFNDLFSELIDPLVRNGSVDCAADFTEETAQQYRKQRYAFSEVDTVLMEGIFLLRRDLRNRYDLKIWVECSFETALRRAIARGQEALPVAETITAYQTIYFPAEEIHLAEDDPRTCADLVFQNDN